MLRLPAQAQGSEAVPRKRHERGRGAPRGELRTGGGSPDSHGYHPGAPGLPGEAAREGLRGRAYVVDHEGSGRVLGGRVGGPDRNEREHHQSEAVSGAAKTGEGGAAPGSRSRSGGWLRSMAGRLGWKVSGSRKRAGQGADRLALRVG